MEDLRKHINTLNTGYDKKGKGIAHLFAEVGAKWQFNIIFDKLDCIRDMPISSRKMTKQEFKKCYGKFRETIHYFDRGRSTVIHKLINDLQPKLRDMFINYEYPHF